MAQDEWRAGSAAGGVLSDVWPSLGEEMDKMRVVISKHRCRLNEDETLLLRRCRDMVTFKYGTLLSV